MIKFLLLFTYASIVHGYRLHIFSRPSFISTKQVLNLNPSSSTLTFQLADLYNIEDFLKISTGGENTLSGVFAVVGVDSTVQFVAGSKYV